MKLLNKYFLSVFLILFVLVLAVNSVSAADNDNLTDINDGNSDLSDAVEIPFDIEKDNIQTVLMDSDDNDLQNFSSNSMNDELSIDKFDSNNSIEVYDEFTDLNGPSLTSVVPEDIVFNGIYHVGPGQQYATIQAALNQCRNNNGNYQIIIHAGTYTGSGNIGLDIEPNNFFSENFGYLDIRTANDGDVVLNANKASNIFTIKSRNVHITGLTFKNAYVLGDDSNRSAGVAIRINSGDVSIDNCSFIDNEAKNVWGGALHIPSRVSNVNITNSLFINNSADVGGVLRAESNSGNINIINNTFINNTATSHGGVSCVFSTHMTFAGCTFINNSAPSSGAIHFHSAGHLVDNCTFINNSANGTGNDGYAGAVGLVYSTNGGVTISNSKFFNNSANNYGGAIEVEGGGSNAKIVNCTLENNTAGYGGAIRIQGSNTLVENSILINNKATGSSGGAIHVEGTSTQILNATFINNSAITNGGAISITGNDAIVSNSLIANNTAANGAGVYIQGRKTTISKSSIENNTASNNGAGVYIQGNQATLKDSTIYNNNASVNGGGVYINGNDASISNVNFTLNNAIPDEEKLDDGLGGAIFIAGGNNHIADSNFTYNTARNGSAIYINPSSPDVNNYIDNCIFTDNQAWSYWLPIFYNNVNKTIETNLTGGNNILNAIHNNGSNLRIFIDGKNPVLGWENSQGGTILYQDNREFNQTIVTLVYDMYGNLVFNETAITDLAGRVSYDIPQDTHSWFIVNMTHLEDTYYKEITNITGININPGLTMSDVTMYEGNATPQTIFLVLTDDDSDLLPKEGPINIYIMINGEKVYIGSGYTDNNALLIFYESLIFKTLNPGNYTTIAEYKYSYWDETTHTIIDKTFSTKANLEVLPYLWSINKTIAYVNGITYTEDMIIHVNDIITFNITVSNNIKDDLTGLKLIDLDTDGLSYISTTGSTWNYEGNNVWSLDNLIGFGNSSLLVNFKVLSLGNLNNTVKGSILNGLRSKSANVTFTVNKYLTNLAVSNHTVLPGTDVTVTITVTGELDNINGVATVTINGAAIPNVIITNGVGTFNFNVPDSDVNGTLYDIYAEFIDETGMSASSNGNGWIKVIQYTTSIVVSNVTVYPGDKVAVTIEVSTEDGALFNGVVSVVLNDAAGTAFSVDIVDGVGSFEYNVPKALVEGSHIDISASYDGDATYLGSEASGWIEVLPVSFHVDKSVDGSGFVIGDEVVFVVVVSNDCDGILYDLTVSDVLPSGVELVEGASYGSWIYDGNSWSYGDLNPGASATLVIPTRAVSAGEFTNVVRATVNDGVLSSEDSVDFGISRLHTSIVVSNVTVYPGDKVAVT
ncbi:right-handed parallel beta-helix repeat-containing protein, partial [Methanobrevibacter sp.]|uniref:right-handed parallel beta-helix repeat-containing protein n=1 Tax=Methanobrevibacter sp. TaxID=66852 RepID=UPI0026DF8195